MPPSRRKPGGGHFLLSPGFSALVHHEEEVPALDLLHR
jgi:hypothetical protein